jgi:hypothetical protein
MRNKIILITGISLLMIGFGSCTMRTVQGTPYRISSSAGGRTFNHVGREKHHDIRKAYWGKHKNGMRPHRYRGRFRSQLY